MASSDFIDNAISGAVNESTVTELASALGDGLSGVQGSGSNQGQQVCSRSRAEGERPVEQGPQEGQQRTGCLSMAGNIIRTANGQMVMASTGQRVVQQPGGQQVGGQQVVQQRPPGGVQQQQVIRQATAPGQAGQQQMAGIQRVVINQPGLRPGQPGAQITVPLSTLQALQAGQGIPTGQPGHLLVKTETGQYQILRVGPPGAVNASQAQPVTVAPNLLPQPQSQPQSVASQPQSQSQSQPQPQQPQFISPARAPLPVMRPSLPTQPSQPQPRLPTAPIARPQLVSQQAPAPSSGASSLASSNSMGQQMTPDTAKIKCKNFLATLLRLASDQPESVARNVRGLIQGLIDGRVEPELFTTKLQKELNSSPQPCLVPFLKKSLPYLQQSLAMRELTIEGVNPPSSAQVGKLPPAMSVAGISAPSASLPVQRPAQPRIAMPQQRPVGVFRQPAPQPGRFGAGQPHTLLPQPKAPQAVVRDKKAGNAYSAAGDDDINDVAAMGGVNLAEEANRILGTTDNVGTVIRSCKDETFLQTGLLHQRISRICREKGLEPPPPEVISLVSHATQDRLKSLVSKLSVIAEHRLDIIKTEGHYEVTQDIRGQLRFLEDLDKMEKKRHEEAEREMLLRAAKSRTKTDDPEKEKMKAKAKEIQRIEQETIRHQEANRTALEAIGGPKKRKFEEVGGGGGGGVGGGGGAGASGSSNVPVRARTKRVHLRDVMFLMEQEKDLKHSNLLFKSYCS